MDSKMVHQCSSFSWRLNWHSLVSLIFGVVDELYFSELSSHPSVVVVVRNAARHQVQRTSFSLLGLMAIQPEFEHEASLLGSAPPRILTGHISS